MIEFIEKNKYLILLSVIILVFGILMVYYIYGKIVSSLKRPTREIVDYPVGVKIEPRFNVLLDLLKNKKVKEYQKSKDIKNFYEKIDRPTGLTISYEMIPVPNSSNININTIVYNESDKKYYLIHQETIKDKVEEESKIKMLGGMNERTGKDLYSKFSLQVAWDVIDEHFTDKLIPVAIKSYSTQVVAGIIYRIVFVAINSNKETQEIKATVMELVNGKKSITLE